MNLKFVPESVRQYFLKRLQKILLFTSWQPLELRVVISSEVSSSNSAPEEDEFERKKGAMTSIWNQASNQVLWVYSFSILKAMRLAHGKWDQTLQALCKESSTLSRFFGPVGKVLTKSRKFLWSSNEANNEREWIILLLSDAPMCQWRESFTFPLRYQIPYLPVLVSLQLVFGRWRLKNIFALPISENLVYARACTN